tara:strand:- start:1251 stop:1484 length:234 start_codon:yes stop_codon:yes gene_type:complete
MFSCVLCEKNEEYLFFSKFCAKCRKIKHHLNLSGERVYEVLDNVLGRNLEGQDNKIKEELKKEIEEKTYNLRNKEKK